MKVGIALFIFLFAVQHPACPIDLIELLESSDEVTHPENLQGTFRMTLISPAGGRRITEVTAYQRRLSDTREDRLFIFTHPPSVKGTGLLVHSYLDQEEDRIHSRENGAECYGQRPRAAVTRVFGDSN